MIGASKEKVRESRRLLQNPYAYLNGEGFYDGVSFEEVGRRKRLNLEPEQLGVSKGSGLRYSTDELCKIARNLQIELWRERHSLWAEDVPVDPIGVLVPSVALEALGYNFELRNSLGQIAGAKGVIEAAGIIDATDRNVWISGSFPPEIQKFTAAHELGHAILHDGVGLHRDRPLDGGLDRRVRDAVELEADKFASMFLMPEKLVREKFRARFNTELFTLHEDTAFALNAGSLSHLEQQCRRIRDLSRILSGAQQFASQHFYSMASEFGVSVEAMAIRLEELRLLRM